MTLKPFGNRVLVKPAKEEEKISEGGIVLVGVKEEVKKGTIAAVGSDTKELKVGDTILYSATAGVQVEVDSEIHLLMFEAPHEVLAVI